MIEGGTGLPRAGRRTLAAAVALLPLLLPVMAAHAQSTRPEADKSAASERGPAIPTLDPIGDQTTGLWLTSYRPGMAPFFDIDAVKFKPWAKGLYDARQAHDLEPHARFGAGRDMFDALVRQVDRIDPGYRS